MKAKNTKMKPKKTSVSGRKKTTPSKKRFSFTRKWQIGTFLVLFAIIGGFFILRSYAATTSGTVSSSSTCTKNCYTYYPMEPKIAFWINNIRQQYGAQYLPLNDCMSDFARVWAANIGPRVSIQHSFDANGTDWYNASLKKCVPASFYTDPTLGTGYRFGEMTIRSPDCAKLSDADCAWLLVAGPANKDGSGASWFTSPKHQAIMLDKRYQVQGIGIWKSPSTGEVFAVAELGCWSHGTACN